MWNPKNRARHDRDMLRYPSDLTDDEWALIGPMIPPAKPGGHVRTVDIREIVNGIMYVLSTGCQWRYIPTDLPPKSTLTTIWFFGTRTIRSSRSTTRYTCCAVT